MPPEPLVTAGGGRGYGCGADITNEAGYGGRGCYGKNQEMEYVSSNTG